MEVAVDPAELGAGFDHAGGAPAQGHRSVLPEFDVAGVIPTELFEPKPRSTTPATSGYPNG
jgi:hypothetical protein